MTVYGVGKCFTGIVCECDVDDGEERGYDGPGCSDSVVRSYGLLGSVALSESNDV